MLAYSDGLNQSDIGEYQAAVSSMEKALEIDDEFEKAESPSDEGVMQLLDLTRTSQNGGYGKNKHTGGGKGHKRPDFKKSKSGPSSFSVLEEEQEEKKSIKVKISKKKI